MRADSLRPSTNQEPPYYTEGQLNWGEMAPSSKSEKDDGKQKAQRKRKDHVVKLLMRGKVSVNMQNVWHEKSGS